MSIFKGAFARIWCWIKEMVAEVAIQSINTTKLKPRTQVSIKVPLDDGICPYIVLRLGSA